MKAGALGRAGAWLAGVWAGIMLGVGAIAAPTLFQLLPLFEAARAGQGSVSFGALHALSSGFFALRLVLVAALAWRLTAPRG